MWRLELSSEGGLRAKRDTFAIRSHERAVAAERARGIRRLFEWQGITRDNGPRRINA
jgi:hypothetical protein